MGRLIIGLVGPIASGKGILSNYLSNNGFVFEKLSDRVREETQRRYLELNRKNLQDVGNDLRQKYGNQILVELTLQKYETDSRSICIDGVRNPGELEFIKQAGGVVIGITAPIELRLKWYLARAKERGEDDSSVEAFIRSNERDLGGGELETGQQVNRCLELSDYVIENSKTISDLIQTLREIIQFEIGIDIEGQSSRSKEIR